MRFTKRRLSRVGGVLRIQVIYLTQPQIPPPPGVLINQVLLYSPLLGFMHSQVYVQACGHGRTRAYSLPSDR